MACVPDLIDPSVDTCVPEAVAYAYRDRTGTVTATCMETRRNYRGEVVESGEIEKVFVATLLEESPTVELDFVGIERPLYLRTDQPGSEQRSDIETLVLRGNEWRTINNDLRVAVVQESDDRFSFDFNHRALDIDGSSVSRTCAFGVEVADVPPTFPIFQLRIEGSTGCLIAGSGDEPAWSTECDDDQDSATYWTLTTRGHARAYGTDTCLYHRTYDAAGNYAPKVLLRPCQETFDIFGVGNERLFRWEIHWGTIQAKTLLDECIDAAGNGRLVDCDPDVSVIPPDAPPQDRPQPWGWKLATNGVLRFSPNGVKVSRSDACLTTDPESGLEYRRVSGETPCLRDSRWRFTATGAMSMGGECLERTSPLAADRDHFYRRPCDENYKQQWILGADFQAFDVALEANIEGLVETGDSPRPWRLVPVRNPAAE